ncbi:pyridoxamine 5'-phosphate oxidase [Euzebya sp.]|uniref:pyridoxamine 5'-phosphate oxidase n=1 Tax=Euzebya sp. TaxID=1971409 RepID=UPI0035183F2B
MADEPTTARMDYGRQPLRRKDLDPDPVAQLQRWLDTAAASDQLVEPTAMGLATVDADGRPALRTVLLRRVVDGRLLFFTNYDSRKARHIEANPHVAALFRWATPQRQVEVRGTVERATTAESDAYFATRPRGAQIGAHASPQSRPLPDRRALELLVEETARRFEGVEVIPRPESWGGYAITPDAVEVWQGRSDRLHDRFRYTRDGDGWTIERLAP